MPKTSKNSETEIDAGLMIRSYMESHGIKVSWLAQQIHTDRCNCYKILKRKSIDLALLVLISKKLEHNFLEDLIETLKSQKIL